jgi:hypothetical protein
MIRVSEEGCHFGVFLARFTSPPSVWMRCGKTAEFALTIENGRVATMALRGVRMKRKERLKVVRKGVVFESELPKELQRQGPKWLKTWPKMRLNRGRSKEKPED